MPSSAKRAGVLARHRRVPLPVAGQESLVRGWRQLRPWPDSREGLDRLRRRHITATLSNGHLALLADLLKFADLRVDVVLSAQLAASYKPDAEVYITALQLLECQPGEAGMVAAHPSDLEAAAALGLRPIFIRRPLDGGPACHRPTRPRWRACSKPTGSSAWPRRWAADGAGGVHGTDRGSAGRAAATAAT